MKGRTPPLHKLQFLYLTLGTLRVLGFTLHRAGLHNRWWHQQDWARRHLVTTTAKTPGTPQCIFIIVLTSYYTGPTLNQHWLNDSSRCRSSSYRALIRAQTAITFRQAARTAYFRSTQLLLFAFARQRIGGEKWIWCVNEHCNVIQTITR